MSAYEYLAGNDLGTRFFCACLSRVSAPINPKFSQF
jgi:hypothetical protein